MEEINRADEADVEQRPIKPCMACMAPMDIDAAVCPECGAVYGSTNALLPTGIISAEGTLLEKLAPAGTAPATRPTKLKLIAVWIIMFPLFALSLVIAASLIYQRQGLQGFVFFWIFAAVAYFAATVIYRVTRGFFGR